MLLYAYLNHGRWVVDCPKCNSADRIDPSHPEFVCKPEYQGCGLSAVVQFPEDFDEIAAVMAVRPSVNQNWRRGESVADLRIENALHKLPSGLEVG